MDALELAARDHVYAYLAGRETFEDFESWVVRHSWDGPHGHLVDRIDAAIIDLGSGELDGDEFAERLRALVSTIYIDAAPLVTGGTSSVTYWFT